MSEGSGTSADRVRQALAALGVAADIREFGASTRTSADAAAAIGCTVAQIAKSLVFKAKPSGRAVLVIASGINRVSEAKLAAAVGEGIGKADATFVRDKTGFAIGGVGRSARRGAELPDFGRHTERRQRLLHAIGACARTFRHRYPASSRERFVAAAMAFVIIGCSPSSAIRIFSAS